MTVAMSFPFEWRCASCRFEQWVHVKARGSNRFPRIDGGNASLENGLAEDRARQDAWRSAKMKLALRPCPRCGAIDRKTVTKTMIRAFVVSTLTSVIVIEGALVMFRVAALSPSLLVVGLLASPVVGAATTAWLWYERWLPSRRDVTVESDTPSKVT